MVHRWIIIGIFAAAGLAGCDSAESTSTTVSVTQVEATTPPAATTGSPAATTLAEDDDELPAGYSELPQLGLQFVVPEPFNAVPTIDFGVRASSSFPRGLFTVTPCGDCPLDREPSDNEVHASDEIDGVSVLIIDGIDPDLPEGVEQKTLFVTEDQRKFFAIMSFEGDIEPLWNEFIESIRFVDPDPAAGPCRVVAADSEPSTTEGGPSAIECAGLRFEWPEGFMSDGETDDKGGFLAVRDDPSRAVIIVRPCPACRVEELDGMDAVKEIEIDGLWAVTAQTPLEGSLLRAVLILTEGHKAFASILGDDTDDAWQSLLDSIQIADE